MEAQTHTLVTPEGLVEITSAPRRTRRDQARAAEHAAFVADNWTSLAAAAWDGYRRHGAGAVVLWRKAAPRRLFRRPFAPERLWYATQVHSLPEATEADFDGWEARRLEDYDPLREALVVIVEGGRLCGHVVRGDASPEAVNARSRIREN